MQKYKIKKFFTDVRTNEQRNPGDVVEFSQERVKEINSVDDSLIELVQPKPKTAPKAKVAKAPDPEPVTDPAKPIKPFSGLK
jgi:hypothetical protein